LSHEHQGFTFEPDPKRAAEMIRHHSGGKGSEALLMALKRDEAEPREESPVPYQHQHLEETSSSTDKAIGLVPEQEIQRVAMEEPGKDSLSEKIGESSIEAQDEAAKPSPGQHQEAHTSGNFLESTQDVEAEPASIESEKQGISFEKARDTKIPSQHEMEPLVSQSKKTIDLLAPPKRDGSIFMCCWGC
jgi:hypothetical protein